MTARRIPVACFAVALLAGGAAGGDAKTGKGSEVQYATGYTGYFVKNNAPIKANPAYLVLSTSEAFNEVFGIGRTMKKVKVIDPQEFGTKTAVVVIKKGNALWNYTVQGVTTEDGTLRVRYQARAQPEGPATYASPLIVLADGRGYTRVVFIENGKEVATVAVKGAK